MRQDFLRIRGETTSEPEVTDMEAEMEVALTLASYAANPSLDVATCDLNDAGFLTSWVAWQVGNLVELAVHQQRYLLAERLAHLSIRVAEAVGDGIRLQANRLSLAGIYMRQEEYEKAEDIYWQILRPDNFEAIQERAMAHLSLAEVHRQQAKVKSALYHMETGLSYLRPTITDEEYNQILDASLRPLYVATGDEAGLLHGAKRLGMPGFMNLFDRLCQNVQTIEHAVFLTYRLRSLGEHDLADQIFRCYQTRFDTPMAQSS